MTSIFFVLSCGVGQSCPLYAFLISISVEILTEAIHKNRQSRTTRSYFCSREIKKTETFWHATLTRRKLITYSLAFIALLFLILIDVAGYIRSPTAVAQDNYQSAC